MNDLLKAPITETAFVPPLKYAHNQLSSVEETLMKIINYQRRARRTRC